MKLQLTLLTALAFAGGLATVQAADAPTRPTPPTPRALPEALQPYDVDKNGKLDREEWKAYVDANKPERPKNPWDTNGDGKLSEGEIEAARAAIRKEIEARCLKHFDDADTDPPQADPTPDGDGFLSLDEFRATLPATIAPERAKKAFDRIDVDPVDGKISEAEFLKACGPHGHPDAPKGPRHPKHPKPPETPTPELPESLKPLDLDNNGVLSRDEIEKAIKAGNWPHKPAGVGRPG